MIAGFKGDNNTWWIGCLRLKFIIFSWRTLISIRNDVWENHQINYHFNAFLNSRSNTIWKTFNRRKSHCWDNMRMCGRFLHVTLCLLWKRLRLFTARVAHNSCSSRILYCDMWQWRMTHVTPILSSPAPHAAFSVHVYKYIQMWHQVQLTYIKIFSKMFPLHTEFTWHIGLCRPLC